MLTDSGSQYAELLGLNHGFPDDLRQVYLGFGADLAACNEARDWVVPLATRIVADHASMIRSIDASADYTLRPEPEATLEVLRGMIG